jgi:hypothetical protein
MAIDGHGTRVNHAPDAHHPGGLEDIKRAVTHYLHVRDHLRRRRIAENRREMVNLVHLVGSHRRCQLRGLGDIAGQENDLIEDVGDSIPAGITVEENQVLACDALFAHQMASQVRAEEARPTGDHYRHFLISLPEPSPPFRPVDSFRTADCPHFLEPGK